MFTRWPESRRNRLVFCFVVVAFCIFKKTVVYRSDLLLIKHSCLKDKTVLVSNARAKYCNEHDVTRRIVRVGGQENLILLDDPFVARTRRRSMLSAIKVQIRRGVLHIEKDLLQHNGVGKYVGAAWSIRKCHWARWASLKLIHDALFSYTVNFISYMKAISLLHLSRLEKF